MGVIFCSRCKQFDCNCPTVTADGPYGQAVVGRAWSRDLPGRFEDQGPQTKKARETWLAKLEPVDLILEHHRVVAALSVFPLSRAQIRVLYGMLPPDAIFQPDLASRWELTHVLTTPDWAERQRTRVPMLPPKGEKVAFL